MGHSWDRWRHARESSPGFHFNKDRRWSSGANCLTVWNGNPPTECPLNESPMSLSFLPEMRNQPGVGICIYELRPINGKMREVHGLVN